MTNDERPTLLEVAKLYHDTYHAALERDGNDRNAPLEALAAVRALCLASRSHSHELVVAADAMRGLFPKAAHDCLLRECSIVDAYDTARARHAESAQPSGAPAPASAQGEVCECGHIAAIHDDRHGDGAHSGSCLEIVGKRSDGSDDFCRCSEFHHAQ